MIYQALSRMSSRARLERYNNEHYRFPSMY